MPMSLELRTAFFTADVLEMESSEKGSAPSRLSLTLTPFILALAALRTSESIARICIPLVGSEGRVEEPGGVHTCNACLPEAEAGGL